MSESPIQLPDPSQLIVSSSPHFHSSESVRRIMWTVLLALLPACVAGVLVFGWHALAVLAFCAAGAVASEALVCRFLGRPNPVADGSALVCGVLLGLNLSASTPWWVCLIGAFIAIGLGKQIYGGLGYNLFNPALVGRVALLIAFPKILTTWAPPMGGWWASRIPAALTPDGLTTATPLGLWQTSDTILQTGPDYLQFFLGNQPGCIGETSALALLLGGALLMAKGYIRWQVPASFIGTVGLLTAILHCARPETQPTPLFHILTGGLMLGAFFMATDMVTTPMGKLGAAIFGIGCGLVTFVIRVWGSYPEGVSFSILFMNALTPMIDRYTVRTPFGARQRSIPTA